MGVPAAGPAIDVLTFKYNNARTGWNAAEKQLTPANVVPATFGKIFTRMVDGQIYAQPLIVSGLSIGGRTRNVVYVVTMKNTIYAFDADDRTATMPLWTVNLGPTVPKADVCGCNDIQPEIGATATPVIDKAAGTIYFTTKHLMGGNYINRLHALDIVSGMPRQGSPVTITGSVPGTGMGAVGGTLNFDSRRHLNRVALLLQGGNVYIAFGSHGDTPPYHGWVFGYNASTLARTGEIFCTTPNAGFGGIWQAGNGLVGDGQNIYFATGNGNPSNPNSNPPGLGEAFVKLDNNLRLVDWQIRGELRAIGWLRCGLRERRSHADPQHGLPRDGGQGRRRLGLQPQRARAVHERAGRRRPEVQRHGVGHFERALRRVDLVGAARGRPGRLRLARPEPHARLPLDRDGVQHCAGLPPARSPD